MYLNDSQVGVVCVGSSNHCFPAAPFHLRWRAIYYVYIKREPCIYIYMETQHINQRRLGQGSMCSGSVSRNLKNGIIAFLVPLPSILFYLSLTSHYSSPPINTNASTSWSTMWYHHHPLLLANLLFFFNVNLLFWIIALFQSTHWMIDPYWTVIPVMLVHYYSAHPLAQYHWWRSKIVILLTWVWSIRLIHNYFRREKWQWGAREDWRFTDMSQHYGTNWWWASFFTIYVPQQLFLMGLSLPFYVIHTVNQPLSMWDLVGMFVCVSGIVIAYFADTQLYKFVSRNEKLKGVGKAVDVPVLDSGLWYYSRHPNYFGEQLWWWGLVVIAWNLQPQQQQLGRWTVFIGALANTMCLAYVTKLVENRMLKQENRAEAYRLYQKTTSVWVPWSKSAPNLGGLKTKNA